MKKILMLSLLCFSLLSSLQAQNNRRLTLTQATGAASDTAVNGGTATLSIPFTSAAEAVGVQATLTRISGTAGGTLQLEGSLDGTNWFAVGSSQTPSNVATGRHVFTVAGQAFIWNNLRLVYTGTGTMSVRMEAFMIAKK